MNNIIIVGNGPSILNRERGAVIDSHKVVARINEFETKGYEKYTGVKQDVYFVGAITPIKHNYTLFNKVVVLTGITRLQSWEIKNSNEEIFPLEYYMVNYQLIGAVSPLKSMSMGVAAIWYYWRHGIKVDITGFDFYEGDITADKLHYYKPHRPLADGWKITNGHSPLLEKEWVDLQAKRGIINII